jgi:hypothetical protein
MKLDYNLPLEFGDYLDKLKMSMIMAKDFRLSPFYTKNTTILSKILFLAWQKGLVSNELLDILDYIPTNEKVLELVYEYKGVASRPIMIKALSIVYNLKNIETLPNEVRVTLQTDKVEEQEIVQSQDMLQIVYKENGLTSMQVGNVAEQTVLSFIKLFLPAGVLLSFNYEFGGSD